MTEAILEWRSYRYFPYELDFARLEAERLFQAIPSEHANGLQIPAHSFCGKNADRLTYFARAVHPGGGIVVPQQARLEASAHVTESERQTTRYSAHGLHEFKGKFNPQVVRAIGNILQLQRGARVLDPFCGSGTTLLECAHAGWDALGIDLNPLAVRIGNAKLRALSRATGPLQLLTEAVVNELKEHSPRLSRRDAIDPRSLDATLGPNWLGDLPENEYLRAWFPHSVLAQVVCIRRVLGALIPDSEDRAIFDVVLSDQLREVSLQDPADLRIRRRKEAQPNYPLIEIYIRALSERIERIARARLTLGDLRGRQRAIRGDIRTANPVDFGTAADARFDAVITSPPYETALPYVDTQRLSLVLFGDVPANQIQFTEKALIGAREITKTERQELERSILGQDTGLPTSVTELCRSLLDAAGGPGNGFRRINRPALALRYFQNMHAFFINLRRFVRPAGRVALVVGPNRTRLGGREFQIDTPTLLADIGQNCGFTLVEKRCMDTYARYDLHYQNSINSEMLIVLSAPVP